MRSNVCQRKILLQVGTIVVSVGALLVDASRTSAGCGDYVIRKSVSSKTELTEPSKSAATMTYMPTSHHRDRHPCSGPFCSNGESSPELPIVPTTPDHEEWAIKTVSQESPTESSGFRSAPYISHPLIQRSEIFHPPRRG